MNEQREVIRAQLSCGVDYYKGEKGDKPIKGVDYFTQADIDSIIEQIEAGEIDLTSYATKEYVNDKIDDIVETDPTVPEWAKQENKPTYTAAEVGALPANTVIPTVPTNVSAFTNDAGYLTSHQSLENYATKSYVEQVVAGIETGALKRSIVSSLPSTGIDENTIYMVANSGSGNDVYDEYLYVNNKWERIGSSAVDLTDYATKNYVDTAVGNIPAYTLPTASTSTLGGVKVDGTTITITDGVISATSSGGGSSYTAGDGISISNDTISVKTPAHGMADVFFALLKNSVATTGLTNTNGLWKSPSTKDACVEALLQGYIINAQAGITIGQADLGLSSNIMVLDLYTARSNQTYLTTSVNVVTTYTLTSGRFYYYNSGLLVEWRNPVDIWSQIPLYTPERTFSTLGAYMMTISGRVPAVPTTTDGTYFLTSTVSSGVATNSWENVVIGGSY